MNSVEKQKSLVEQLEALLQEAIKKSPLDPVHVEKIVLELKDARAEHERLLRISPKPVSPPPLPAVTAAQEPELNLLLNLQWEPRHITLLNNLKSLFTHETKVYKLTANPIETNLLVEPIPWYRTISS